MMLWRGEYQSVNITDEKNETTGLSSMNAQNRMLVITTYNEQTKEGKVITISIIRLGDGTLDRNPKTQTQYTG